jgi:hypothetical protein
MIKPLVTILSCRDIQFVKEGFDKINYIDKVWIKYCEEPEAIMRAFEYFFEHKEYTHMILHSDDAVPDYESIAQLIADDEKYDFPVVSGVIKFDKVKNEDWLAITIESSPIGVSLKTLPSSILELKSIIRVWFQGMALMMIRRDVAEKICPIILHRNIDGVAKYIITPHGDLASAIALDQLGIPQYTDLRVWYWHFRTPIYGHEREWSRRIGFGQPTIFEPATAPIPPQSATEILDPFPEELRQKIKEDEKKRIKEEFYARYGPQQRPRPRG